MIARAGVFFGRRGPVRPKWYVDSVHGDDGNNGAGPGSALRTIAALAGRIQAGDRVGLARGSAWREQLTLPVDGVEVLAYGNGAKPLLDCSDAIAASGWSKTDGYANVHQCTLPVDAAGWMSVWEEDVRFRRATSMEDLDATAGRYLPSGDPSAAGEVTLYVHSSDGSNPAENGKKYEYGRRAYGLYTDRRQCKVTGIETRRNLGNNGSLEVGRDCALIDCRASEGTKHNLLLHAGCTLTRVEAADSYYAGQAKALIVWNEDTPEGQGLTFVDCYAHDEFEGNATAYYGHRNVSGSFGQIVLRGCRADHVQVALPAIGDCAGVTIDGCDLWVVGCMVDTTITGSIIRGNFRCLNMVGGPVVTLRDSLIIASYSVQDGADVVVFSPYPGATLNIQRSRVEGTVKDGSGYMLDGICMDGPNATLVSRFNNFLNLAHFYVINAEGYTLDSDYNQFNGPILGTSFRLPGWQWQDFPQWKATTGQDSHSTP